MGHDGGSFCYCCTGGILRYHGPVLEQAAAGTRAAAAGNAPGMKDRQAAVVRRFMTSLRSAGTTRKPPGLRVVFARERAVPAG